MKSIVNEEMYEIDSKINFISKCNFKNYNCICKKIFYIYYKSYNNTVN